MNSPTKDRAITIPGDMNAWRILSTALHILYEELYHLLLMGALTTLAILLPPLLAIWLLLLQRTAPPLLLLIGLPLALSLPGMTTLGGIWGVAYAAVQERGVTWPLYWEGIRLHRLRALKSAALMLGGYLGIASNLFFYANPPAALPAGIAVWIIPIWVTLALIWSGIGFYLLSFQFEMASPRLFLALRNSLYMTLLHPLNTTLWLLAVLLGSLLIVILPPSAFLLPPLIAVLSLTGLQAQLSPVREKLKAARDKDKTEV